MECPKCGKDMKPIAKSEIKKDGSIEVSYKCCNPFCKCIVKVKE